MRSERQRARGAVFAANIRFFAAILQRTWGYSWRAGGQLDRLQRPGRAVVDLPTFIAAAGSLYRCSQF